MNLHPNLMSGSHTHSTLAAALNLTKVMVSEYILSEEDPSDTDRMERKTNKMVRALELEICRCGHPPSTLSTALILGRAMATQNIRGEDTRYIDQLVRVLDSSNAGHQAARQRMFEPDRLPARIQGWVEHPDLPWGSKTTIYSALLEDIGFDFAVVPLDSDRKVTRQQLDCFYRTGGIYIGWWNPKAPAGSGWLLASINYYSDQGPAAQYVRLKDLSSEEDLFGPMTTANIQAALAEFQGLSWSGIGHRSASYQAALAEFEGRSWSGIGHRAASY